MLFAIGDALADGSDHITGLSDTDTHLSTLVSDDDDGAETHFLTTFNGLGDPADLNHALLPFGVALLIASITAASAAAVTTFTTATAATLFLLLAFRGCGDIGGAWHRVGVGLGRGICHG